MAALFGLGVLFVLLGLAGARIIQHWDREALVPVYFVMLAGFAALLLLIARIREVQLDKLYISQRNIVLGLANLAELRDPDTGRHLERTRGYGVILASFLRGLPKYRKLIDDNFIADLYEAAPLHDLGKVGIPDRILLKQSRLDAEEFLLIQRHTLNGARIIEEIIARFDSPEPFLTMSRNIARHHHEKYDGTGYPEGLAGEAIPLEARIYALGDAYDAIRAKRPYKKPATHLEATGLIRAGQGSHFDPDVTAAFLHCAEQFSELFESYQVYDDVYLRLSPDQARQHGGGTVEPALAWSREFEIGVDTIDCQHREMINRINLLMSGIRHGKGQEEILPLVAFLQEYVIEHFRTEEAYMRQRNYPDYPAHKEMHDSFVADLDALVAELTSTGVRSEHVVLINRQVINWVVAHIFLMDKGLRQ